jgi:hypothetical protein
MMFLEPNVIRGPRLPDCFLEFRAREQVRQLRLQEVHFRLVFAGRRLSG